MTTTAWDERVAAQRAERRERRARRKERKQHIFETGKHTGRPITPTQATALIEGVRKARHHRSWRGLAERGLLDPVPHLPPVPDDWPLTFEGVRVRDALRAAREAADERTTA